MALTLFQIRERSLETGVKNRVAAAVWKAAYLILVAESPDAGQLTYAKTLIGETEDGAEVAKFIRAVCVNATIAATENWASVPDNDIDYVVQTAVLPKLAVQ
jgi:hypothetical protein